MSTSLSSSKKILFLLLIFSNLFINLNCLSCGKSEPKKDKDCTKYGTDSGFLCCSVRNDDGIECQLRTFKWAENNNIKGTFTFDNGTKIDCGNNSKYIQITFSLFLIMFFIF
jgi:hypothetical protein